MSVWNVESAIPARARTGPRIVLFCLLAYGLAWAVVAPLWIGGAGLDAPYATFLLSPLMLTPAIAAVVVLWSAGYRRGLFRVSGLTVPRPRRALVGYLVLGTAVGPVVIGGGLLLTAAFGTFHTDLADFSAFREFAEPMGLTDAAGKGVPTAALAAFAGLQLLLFFVNVPIILGEEWGWRGYLLPALLPWGTWRAMALHGAIWGAWHAPVVLLGYNFGRRDLAGVGMMIVWCVLLGTILGWLRIASGSVWPAVAGHTVVNQATSLTVVFGVAGAEGVPEGFWLASGAVMFLVIAVGVLWARHARGRAQLTTHTLRRPG